MKSTQYYPVLMVDDVPATADFYKNRLRFTPRFESDWYVHLQSTEDESVNLAIMRGDRDAAVRREAQIESRFTDMQVRGEPFL